MGAARENLELGITASSGYGLSGGWMKSKPGKSDNGAIVMISASLSISTGHVTGLLSAANSIRELVFYWCSAK